MQLHMCCLRRALCAHATREHALHADVMHQLGLLLRSAVPVGHAWAIANTLRRDSTKVVALRRVGDAAVQQRQPQDQPHMRWAVQAAQERGASLDPQVGRPPQACRLSAARCHRARARCIFVRRVTLLEKRRASLAVKRRARWRLLGRQRRRVRSVPGRLGPDQCLVTTQGCQGDLLTPTWAGKEGP